MGKIMGNFLLAIDIGNTAVKTGLCKSGAIFNCKTSKINDVPKYINKFIKSGKYNHLDVLICSVDPKKTSYIKKSMVCHNNAKLWVLGSNIDLKIRHNYKEYNKLGMDRKVGCYGALKMYKMPLLIISYGTAITCDYLDRTGTFQGGLIIPGPAIALKALSKSASLLPTIHFPRKKPGFLGRDTKKCMEYGILEGYGSMADELARRFKIRYDKKIRVLATGGLSKTIAPHSASIDILDPFHTLKSLALIWREKIQQFP